jgi:iron complex outermembrane recepter protein
MRNRLLKQIALATMLFGSVALGSVVSPALAQDTGAAKEAASAEAVAAKAKADKEKADKEAAAKAKAAGTTQIEEIVVTANRRDQGVQKVSGVVQTITGDQLRKDGIADVRQLQAAIPGLSIANQEGNVEIYIRGVGSSNNTELGDPGAAPHLNGVYIPRPRGLGLQFYDLERVEVNKGPQGTLYGRNALAGTLNIITAKPRLGERSGYIQGEVANRSGSGAEGAINIPLGDNAALRAAGFYTKKDYGFTNASTGAQASQLKPAGLEENYAGRLSFLWDPTSALSVSVVGDYGKERGTGYPGANIFSAIVASNTGTNVVRPGDLDITNVVYRGLQGEMTNTLWGIQAKAAYDFDKVTAEFTVSNRSVDFYQRNASSNGIVYPTLNLADVQYDNFSGQFWQTKSKSQTYEFRLSSRGKQRLTWSTGLFHFNEDQEVGFLALADRGYCCYSGTEFTFPDVKGESTAAFADGTFEINDAWRVLAGVRQTTEKKSRNGIGGNLALTLGGEDFACCVATRFGTEGFVPNLLSRPNFNVTGLTRAQTAQFLIDSIRTAGSRDTLIQQIQAIANGTNNLGNCFIRSDINNGFVKCPALNPSNTNGGFSYANLTIPTAQIGSSKANYSDFRLGFEHDLSKDNMLYAKVSTGHKAGGFNDSFNGSNIPEVFSPEKILVYEIGSRNSVSMYNRRSTFNVTGFYYDYSNQVFQDLTCINLDTTQTPPVCNGYSLVNRNIGASRLAGLEAESKIALPSNFTLDLNLTLLNTKITKGVVADSRAQDFGNGGVTPIISLVGNELPLASKINLNGRLSHFIPVGSGTVDWQILANYRSAYYLTQFNEDDVVLLNGSRTNAIKSGFPDRQKGFTTVNVGTGYSFDKFRIEFWAANVFNKQASQKAIVGSNVNVRFLNDARIYGLRARYTF